MTYPRKKACLTLVRQEQNGYSNLVLANALEDYEGDKRDKAFISALFYGTLERKITLDYILAQHLTKPLNKLDKEVCAVLRMGLYQALYMNSVPVSAAINESVSLAKQLKKTSASGLVNAVLRKAVKFDLSSANFKSQIERLSVLYSVSPEIAKIFIANFAENAEKELEATFKATRLCIRVNTIKTNKEDLIKSFESDGITAQNGDVENSVYLDFNGDITSAKQFKQGLFHVQGEASQYACLALNAKKGSKTADLCSAPGGKAATIAQYMQNDGLLLCADASANRLTLIETLLKRNGVTCANVLKNNAEVYNKEFENCDYVLCDVPCSGLGIISKKPDIRFKTLEDLSSLIKLQKSILETAASYVKKGGKLVYSTCTINSAENEDVVNSFILNNDNFKIIPSPNVIKGGYKKQDFRLFTPLSSNSDGFFVATLERLC